MLFINCHRHHHVPLIVVAVPDSKSPTKTSIQVYYYIDVSMERYVMK